VLSYFHGNQRKNRLGDRRGQARRTCDRASSGPKRADIILHYNHSEKEAGAAREEIEKFGVKCRLAQADLSDSKQILKMTGEIYKNFKSVDILVNSASLFYKTPIQDVQESDWDAFIDANLKGPFILSGEIGNRMASERGGKIVNIADWSGFRPYKDYSPYCVSKEAHHLDQNAGAGPCTQSHGQCHCARTHLETEGCRRKKTRPRSKNFTRPLGSPQDIANGVSF